jgi:hypothetical protein
MHSHIVDFGYNIDRVAIITTNIMILFMESSLKEMKVT